MTTVGLPLPPDNTHYSHVCNVSQVIWLSAYYITCNVLTTLSFTDSHFKVI